MTAMIIKHEKNLASFHVCPGCRITMSQEAGPIKIIPTYYSDKHAYDEGWRPIANRRWCKPGEEAVWICPECAKGVAA